MERDDKNRLQKLTEGGYKVIYRVDNYFVLKRTSESFLYCPKHDTVHFRGNLSSFDDSKN